MMKLIVKTTIMAALLTVAFTGCTLDQPSDPTGQVNPPTPADAGAQLVTIGNSLTAGFMDSGLHQAGQASSFSRQLALQMGIAAEDFTQPWIADPGIGTSTHPDPGQLAGVLYLDLSDTTIGLLGTPIVGSVQATAASLLLASSQPVPYHNLGVPGAYMGDALTTFTSANSIKPMNSYFDFICRPTLYKHEPVNTGYPSPGGLVPVTYNTASIFSQAVAKGPARATVWLGGNDILLPATSGNPGAAPEDTITSVATFQKQFTDFMSVLAGGLAARNGFPATIVVGNMPSISDIPTFLDEAVFDGLVNSQIGMSWPGGYEEANVNKVLFSTLLFITSGVSPATPIPSNYTLTDAEAGAVDAAVIGYNQVIDGVVAAINGSGTAKVAVADMNTALNDLTPQQKTHLYLLILGGMTVEQAAATSYFSLDGVHPNNVGYGYTANVFIDKFNELEGTSIPDVDLGTLTYDPTYGRTPARKAGVSQRPLISPEAAEALYAIFRK